MTTLVRLAGLVAGLTLLVQRGSSAQGPAAVAPRTGGDAIWADAGFGVGSNTFSSAMLSGKFGVYLSGPAFVFGLKGTAMSTVTSNRINVGEGGGFIGL